MANGSGNKLEDELRAIGFGALKALRDVGERAAAGGIRSVLQDADRGVRTVRRRIIAGIRKADEILKIVDEPRDSRDDDSHD